MRCTPAASIWAWGVPAVSHASPQCRPRTARALTNGRTPNGLLIPPRFDSEAAVEIAALRVAQGVVAAAGRGIAGLHRAGR